MPESWTMTPAQQPDSAVDVVQQRRVVLPGRLLAELHRQAEDAYPRECCTVLLGRHAADVWTVETVRSVPNPAAESNRYQVAAENLIRIHDEARRLQQAIIGFHHSHPDQPPPLVGNGPQ